MRRLELSLILGNFYEALSRVYLGIVSPIKIGVIKKKESKKNNLKPYPDFKSGFLLKKKKKETPFIQKTYLSKASIVTLESPNSNTEFVATKTFALSLKFINHFLNLF